MDDRCLTPAARRRAFARLVALMPRTPATRRWPLLMAAHVIGQPDLRLHFASHLLMLRQAAIERDAGEVAGQLLRLALAPLGHLLSRLPAGNTGRSTVSAFRAMVPPLEVRRWIARALRNTRGA